VHIHLVDQYCHRESLVHRLDPRVKAVVTVLLIVGITTAQEHVAWIYPTMLALVMSLALAAEVSPWFVVRRAFVALPFALVAVTLVFTMPGKTLITVPLLGWRASDTGLIRFAAIVLKSWLSVQVAVLLAATTHFTDLLWALHSLRVPKVLVAIIAFMYRYLFILADESLRLRRARAARSAALHGRGAGSPWWRAKVTGGLVGNLFLRSYERSERVYAAMVARGYAGELRVLSPPPLSWRAVIIGAAPVLTVVGIQLLAHWWA
jgi:cobalt/nickel transport system permease protein